MLFEIHDFKLKRKGKNIFYKKLHDLAPSRSKSDEIAYVKRLM